MEKDRSLDDFLGGGKAAEDVDAATDDASEADASEIDDNEADAGETCDEAAEVDAPIVSDITHDSEPATESDDVTVAPATPTYRWIPGGEPCPNCGETVEREWFDDGRFVCSDCKEW